MALGREQTAPCDTRNISYYLAAHFALQSPGFGDTIGYVQHFATSRAASALPKLAQQLWYLPMCLLLCGEGRILSTCELVAQPRDLSLLGEPERCCAQLADSAPQGCAATMS